MGQERVSHQRDLYQAIEQKIYPKWTMYIQGMTQEQADAMENNPFDLTKMWLKKDYPLMPVGEFELNRNPSNYFADIEQAGFNPASVVPGISFSPDRMLQGRLFSYGDAQRYRLGVNHHQIPVNMPKAVKNPHSFHRDGQMRVDGNLGSELHYEPNSYGNWQDSPANNDPMEKGGDIYRYDFRSDDDDYYTQPGLLFNAMTEDQQQVLFDNTARNMGDSTLQIKHRHIYNCYQADPAYGKGVAMAMNISIDEVDLNLPRKNSQENLKKANNMHPELNTPTMPVNPGREIDTNTSSYIEPENDPWLL